MSVERAGSAIQIRARTELGSPLPAYLSIPAAGHGAGVLVVHEAWGLVDATRDVCDRLAREGFVAVAPDLFRGETAADPASAALLVEGLSVERAAEDLQAGVLALLDQSSVDGARVGVIGFCMGGHLALYVAARSTRIGAVVDCYGIHPGLEIEADKIEAPVLGIFGEDDEIVPVERARTLEAELRAAGVRAHFEIVPGVGHAFLNPDRPDRYSAVAAQHAWRDLLAFLRGELV